MTDLILHHFDISPFAEKGRLALGLKRLAWRSVQIPLVMPKPKLTALTGGYRKTPVLQIGADIYCDTRRIALELERRHPEPTLFPYASEGLALGFQHWSDTAFFEPGAGLSMGVNAEIPEDLLADRMAFFNFMDFDRLPAEIPHLYGQLRAQAGLVNLQLADGRRFLLGERPGWIDVCAYFVVWMARSNVAPVNELFAPLEHLPAWEGRVAALGHGERAELDADEALAIARDAEPSPGRGVNGDDPLGLAAGARVAVSPDDYGRDAVVGELVTLTPDEIAVRRDTDELGAVTVHFPRIGYRVTAE